MAEITRELMYELLERMQADLSEMKSALHRVEADVRSLKPHMGDFMHSEARQDGELAELRLRVQRIERRLDIVE